MVANFRLAREPACVPATLCRHSMQLYLYNGLPWNLWESVYYNVFIFKKNTPNKIRKLNHKTGKKHNDF